MTDADADLPQPAELAAAMKAKRIRVYLLALGHGSALPALRSIAHTTGGFVVEQVNPQRWITGANQLLCAALPTLYQHQTVALIPGPGSVVDWNRTWLKDGAIVIQRSAVAPMIARWPLGSGQVAAIAYAADGNTVRSLAQQIAQPPADPRFEVTWDAGPVLRVTVNALDRVQYINGQSLTLELQDAHALDSAPSNMAIPQTGPGLYPLTLPAPGWLNLRR